jgi:hypothetical protein
MSRYLDKSWKVSTNLENLNLDWKVWILQILTETKNNFVSTVRIISTGFKSWSGQIEKSQSQSVPTVETPRLSLNYKDIFWGTKKKPTQFWRKIFGIRKTKIMILSWPHRPSFLRFQVCFLVLLLARICFLATNKMGLSVCFKKQQIFVTGYEFSKKKDYFYSVVTIANDAHLDNSGIWWSFSRIAVADIVFWTQVKRLTKSCK